MIPARITHSIQLTASDLPEEVGDAIIEALTLPNLEREKAKKHNVFGWQQMPKEIELWEYFPEDGALTIPRGFALDLAEGLDHYGIEIEFDDERSWMTWEGDFTRMSTVEPREHQPAAIEAMLEAQQGIYKAPAGSGKTAAVLLAIRKVMAKSIVIVNTKDIIWQWQERVPEFIGDVPIGQIGDGIFEISPVITIATAQTLHSRFDQLERDGFFDLFGFMCLDECHHATADTYSRVVNRFSARYRVGVSATPDKTGDFRLATTILGPVIHTTKRSDVKELMTPEVIKVPTRFGFGFRSAVGRRRSNYGDLIDALINDRERNELIVSKIMENEGHHQLLVSKRLQHLTLIHDMLIEAGFLDPVVTIVGKDDNKHRQEAKALAEVSPCLTLSTLADEAMDIPRLDRLHLPFPQRNAGLVTQQAGRVARRHPDKEDAKIYDYCDLNVGPLEKQWFVRRWEVYEPHGYTITTERKQHVEN